MSSKTIRVRIICSIAPLLALIACSDQTGPGTSANGVTKLLAISPQPDSTVIGRARTLRVRAVDQDGNGVAGVEITWRATEPGDLLDPMVDTTDASGAAMTTLRTSAVAGLHGVWATTSNQQTLSFSVHVRPAESIHFGLEPRRLDLISRQTAQLHALPTSARGDTLDVPIEWGTSDGNIAVVDANGLIRARRPGTAIIYVSTPLPPFSVDSTIVNVRFAVPARIDVSPQPENLIVGRWQRMRAMAFDSAGRPIDAQDIAWSFTTPQTEVRFSEVFDDSMVVYVSAATKGTGTMTARVRELARVMPVNAIADPVIETVPLATPSFCYSGVTFGPSGQWYYISNAGGSRFPADTFAVVRTGRAGVSAWTSSDEFVECDRTYPTTRPLATISVDAQENLYIPARRGVLSISGASGAGRWFAPIGSTRGNIAVSNNGLVFAGREGEVVALDAATGDVAWRFTPTVDLFSRVVATLLDEDRDVVYAATGADLYALDIESGTLRWRLPLANSMATSVAIARNGDLYVGGASQITTVTPDGSVKASRTLTGVVSGAPLIDGQGRVYAATRAGMAYAFTADLQPLWELKLWPVQQFSVETSDAPVIDADGTLYFGYSGELHAIREGRLLWSRWDTSTGWGFFWIVGPDGALYASTHANVHRVATGGLDPQADWPMTYRTPDRSARVDHARTAR